MATTKFQREIRVKTIGFIATALSLVVGLAWNDAVRSSIELLFPLDRSTIFAKFLYAGLVTLLVVTAIVLLMRLVEEKEE